MTYIAKHISVTIHRAAANVYNFIANPQNLPQWAAGLSGSITQVDGDWMAESPMGLVKVVFAAPNSFGVLDHHVTLPAGETFYNPMRVFPNDAGCECVFTLFRRPDMSDAEFAADEAAIRRDLGQLKSLLEQP